MRRLILAVLLSTPLLALGQDRSAELAKAAEEARVACLSVKDAEQRREQSVESQPGERLGTAGGGARQTDEYWQRQGQLDQQVDAARQRCEDAQKRWNDLK